MALSRSEMLRKVTHMSMGLFAFAVGWLGPLWSAVLAATALVFNLFLLPRIGGRRLYREHELSAGSSIGIILYPLAVLILILLTYYGGAYPLAVGAYNAVTALDDQGGFVGTYRKAHLVPYGEYLALRWLLEPLGATRLVAGTGARNAPISYGRVIGHDVASVGYGHRIALLKYGLTGHVPDGMLIRVSSIDDDEPAAFAAQDVFLRDMLDAMAPDFRRRILGLEQG